jgi:hypothetical protein
MRGAEPGVELLLDALDRGAIEHARAHQMLGIGARGRDVRGDALVHDRLRERRIVHLVVAVLAVAHEIDAHVALEAHAVLERQRDRLHARLGVIAVDMEHRRIDHAHDRRRIARDARVVGRGRESDLIVDDEVDRTAGLVRRQLRQRQRLRHDALAREGRVAVDETPARR